MEQRQNIVNRLKMDLIMNNFGLPSNYECIYGTMSLEDIRRTFKAVKELYVRLDLFVATGESSKGTIFFPEAKRQIEYNFIGKKPENSTIMLKALLKR